MPDVSPKDQANEAKEIAAGLLGAIFADSSLTKEAQDSKVTEVVDLRSAAMGQGGAGAPAQTGQIPPDIALSELQAMNRAAEIPSLDNAARILTGVTALLTGVFTGVGFTTGDFVRMIRDFQWQGITFLILAGVALLLGTFAFIVNAYRSPLNLWIERSAVYLGIACASAAFILAAWGISQGASAGPTRPTISASFGTTSSTPALMISVNSSDVPRSEHMIVTIWGNGAHGWTVLNDLVTGPSRDGAVAANMTVDNVANYSQVEAAASLSSADVPVPAAPPSICPADTSCDLLVGYASSARPTATPTHSK